MENPDALVAPIAPIAPVSFERVLSELAKIEILEPFTNELMSPLGSFVTKEEKEIVLAYYAIETHAEYLSPNAPPFLTQMTTATHEHKLEILSDARFLEMFRANFPAPPFSFYSKEKEKECEEKEKIK